MERREKLRCESMMIIDELLCYHLARSLLGQPGNSISNWNEGFEGLGFVTSITFIFLVGVIMSSWLGASILQLGEWFIKKMPLISYIYSASKQISAAISPDQNSRAFKEVAMIKHPRIGEYTLAFITSTVTLHSHMGEEELFCVYVPTNHLYLGDMFLVNSKDILRPNLSVREGIEIVISGGMSIPQILTTVDAQIMRAVLEFSFEKEDRSL
uniref:Uncharacterized protein n=1 Tax=Chenopodium quinoa TaxID=63459 RepID=A0A803KVV2_CHEQI